MIEGSAFSDNDVKRAVLGSRFQEGKHCLGVAYSHDHLVGVNVLQCLSSNINFTAIEIQVK